MNKMAAPDELAVNTSSPEKGGRRGSQKKNRIAEQACSLLIWNIYIAHTEVLMAVLT